MDKIRVQKLRRKLRRLGFSLYKWGRGGNYGYMIVDDNCHVIAAGDCGYSYGSCFFKGLTLDEVEDWLNEE